jgi:serine/threonine-protein kinase
MSVTAPDPPNSSDLDAHAAEYLAAAERGEAPDPADWLAQHPDHAADLAQFLADLGMFGPFLGLPGLPRDLDLTADFAGGVPGSAAQPGERFGAFELVEKLGEGGMGEVFRAVHVGTRLAVALKRLKPGLGGDEAQRLLGEARAAARLNHAHIVRVYHADECAGRSYFTMQLVEGGSLDRHIETLRTNPRAAVELMVKVARAVHHAHQRQVVHRDLKPANILLDERGEPLVADFGLATRLDADRSDSGTGGSLPWMAPEALRGEPVTTGVDVWAFGVILYELLTGARPFRGQTRAELRDAILSRAPDAPRTVNPKISADLEAVCLRCLVKDPPGRYESASAVALELERWLRDEAVRARTPTRRERAARWYRHNPTLAGAVLLLAGLLGGGAILGVGLAEEQAAALRTTVCQGNEHTAWHAANSVLLKLTELAGPVSRAADDVRLRSACRSGDAVQLQGALDALFPPGGPYETVYVLNPKGVLVAHVASDRVRAARVIGRSYPDRDYFTGARAHGHAGGLDRIHISRVFDSEDDRHDKFALSCPVHPGESSAPAWVLAATITTDDTLGLIRLQGGNQKTTLLAPRDPSSRRGPHEAADQVGYLILVHDAFHGNKGAPCVPFPLRRSGPVPSPNGRPELHLPGLQTPPTEAPLAQDQDYRDPVAEHGYPEYSGRWLTGSARVGNTEMVVIVQQRYEVAVAPQRRFFRRLGALAGAVLGGAVLGVAGVWMVRRRRTRSAPEPEK